MTDGEHQLSREGMHERITEYTLDVHQAFNSAEEESKNFNHTYLGSEHILYGLVVAAPKPLSDIFTSLEITPAKVHEQIEEIIGAGLLSTKEAGIRPSPRVKNIVEGARLLALDRKAQYVDTTFITLSLCRELGVASQILDSLNIDTYTLAEQILIQAGFDEDQIHEWIEACEAYRDEQMYSMFTDFTEKLDVPYFDTKTEY